MTAINEEMSAFEAWFGAADVGDDHGRAQRVGIVEEAGEKGRQGVAGDAKTGGDNVEVHDDLGDDE